MHSQKDTVPPPETERAGSREQGGSAAGERMLWRVWEDVRRGAAHFPQGGIPSPNNRLEQFAHGLCLPFHMAGALFEDRAALWRYLKVGTLQAITIVVLAVLVTGSGREVVETVGPEVEERQEEAEEARLDAEAALREAREAQELEKKLVEAQRRTREAQALAGAAGIAEAVAQFAQSGAAEEQRAKVKAAVAEAQRAAQKARELRRAVKNAEREQRRTVRRVVYWAALFSALQIAQWIVIALSRDYHTALSRELSLRVGLPPEDEPLTPRVRLNLEWLRNKMKRRWRGLLAFGLGMPLLYALKWLLPAGALVFTVLASLWGAWWFLVFTAAKSARAWADPAPRAPWFLRGWSWLSERFALFRWSPFGMYSSVWTTFTRPLFSPAASVERQPWTLGGLAVVRALSVLPLLKCYLRPLVPVAAAWLLAEGGIGEGSASRPGAASAPESGSPPPAGAPPAPPPAPGGAAPTTG